MQKEYCDGKVLRNLTNNKAVLLEMNIENNKCVFPSTISDALIDAKKLLYKTFKKNKKMLKALNLKKKDFSIKIIETVDEALQYKYQLKEI